MSLRTIRVTVTNYGEDGPTAARAVRALLDKWMPECFRPVNVSGLWAGELLPRRSEGNGVWEGVPMWPGERATDAHVTVYTGESAAFGPLAEADYSCQWEGALLHRAPGEDSAEWRGHIQRPATSRHPAQLILIASVSIEYAGLSPAVSVAFPFGGYPLTSLSPVQPREGDAIRTADMEAVEQNRERLLRWMAKLPGVLGWKTSGLEWEINFDDALFQEDAAALQEWQRRLREGEI